MKKYTTILGIVTGVAIIAGLVIHVIFPMTNIWDTSADVSENYDLDNISNVSDLNSILCDVNASDMTITADKNVKVVECEYSGSKQLKPVVDFENGRLTIKQKGSTVIWGIHFGKKLSNIDIRINPSVKLEKLDINADAGNVTVEGISAEKLAGDFDAGNVKVSDCKIDSFKCDADAGDVNLSDSRIDTIKTDCDAGNIDISDCEFKDLSSDCDAGNISISGVKDLDKYDIIATVDMGSVKINGEKVSSNFKQNGNGNKTISLDADLGNISIN